ncbi:MAG TPA: DUF4244 domain-containing protein [Amycolatopsis sp.]|nr:DUF4244 domain-containing protein [Amycolatopsis sp.]
MFWQTTGRHTAPRKPRWWRRWFRTVVVTDDGMSTAEYAVGTLAAVAFASVLYVVVSGDSVSHALSALVEHALAVSPS